MDFDGGTWKFYRLIGHLLHQFSQICFQLYHVIPILADFQNRLCHETWLRAGMHFCQFRIYLGGKDQILILFFSLIVYDSFERLLIIFLTRDVARVVETFI